MNVRDTISFVFMSLTLASWLAIASLLTETRALASEARDAAWCAGNSYAAQCDESVNISASTDDSDLLASY